MRIRRERTLTLDFESRLRRFRLFREAPETEPGARLPDRRGLSPMGSDTARRPALRTAGRAAVSAGAALIGLGVATLAEADLGLAFWTVLQQGVSVITGLALGTATMLVTACVLLLWIPMRVKPGWGTIIAAGTVGPTINVAMDAIEPPTTFWIRLVLVLASIALVGLGTGLYLAAGFGPGARDGLMTGLNRITGWSIRRVRLLLEVGVVVLGFLLGREARSGHRRLHHRHRPGRAGEPTPL